MKDQRSYSLRVICAILTVVFGIAGCANFRNQNDANVVLTKVGKFAEDSFYSCMFNGYAQGLSPTQARDECATQLLGDDQKGFGGSIADISPTRASYFDPSKITAACNSGDPTRGQSSGQRGTPGHGINTWGPESNESKGLSQKESDQQKADAVAHWENEAAKSLALAKEADSASRALDEARREAQKDPGNKDKEKRYQEAKAKSEAADKAFQAQSANQEKASDKANEDPNAKAPKVSRGVEGESTCEQALQGARELLRECHRTQWKDFRCQQLQAKMNNCPDPALILVDPDQGYSCGGKVDPEALKNAWVARCQERKKYGPDGSNPCEPPVMDRSGRFGQGKKGDICTSPYAQTDPDRDDCSAVKIGKEFGKIDINDVIVIFLNKFGGPIVVIPANPNPPPRPGSDPRPGPTPK